MKDFLYFNHRSNYDTFSFSGKRIILYDDHRSILNVLFFAKKMGLFKKTPNIITFDYHDDSIIPTDTKLNRLKELQQSELTIESFWNYVEFEISPLDDDWMTIGCELGLINNAIIFGTEQYHNVSSFKNKYKDQNGKVHEIYALSHLDDELDERGTLGDYVKCEKSYLRTRQILQFNENNTQDFSEAEIYPFILDFDLDCFSYDCVNRRIAWPESIFIEKYIQHDNYNLMSPQQFIKELIKRSEVITICREHNSCGGLGESFKILHYLDKYFFNNNLKTLPCA